MAGRTTSLWRRLKRLWSIEVSLNSRILCSQRIPLDKANRTRRRNRKTTSSIGPFRRMNKFLMLCKRHLSSSSCHKLLILSNKRIKTTKHLRVKISSVLTKLAKLSIHLRLKTSLKKVFHRIRVLNQKPKAGLKTATTFRLTMMRFCLLRNLSKTTKRQKKKPWSLP